MKNLRCRLGLHDWHTILVKSLYEIESDARSSMTRELYELGYPSRECTEDSGNKRATDRLCVRCEKVDAGVSKAKAGFMKRTLARAVAESHKRKTAERVWEKYREDEEKVKDNLVPARSALLELNEKPERPPLIPMDDEVENSSIRARIKDGYK